MKPWVIVEMNCSNCNAVIEAGRSRCGRCGIPIAMPVVQLPWLAIVWQLLLTAILIVGIDVVAGVTLSVTLPNFTFARPKFTDWLFLCTIVAMSIGGIYCLVFSRYRP